MSIFDHTRLTKSILNLDVEGIRRGLYSDKYFENVARILSGMAGQTASIDTERDLPFDPSTVDIGNIEVEVQVFNRRRPRALIAGIDYALSIVRHCTGYYDENDRFVETWADLEVDAVEDGVFTTYGGDPMDVQTVLEIRGRYRDFALLETAILGVLSRASRVATNVYNVLEVCNGKPVLFFPARFDLPEVQAADGYAYRLAVQRYNRDFNQHVRPLVSTDAQALWWGGKGGGTTPHALIAAFMADSVAAMVAFAEQVPVGVPRTLLADFNNDVGTDIRRTLKAYWERYSAALDKGDKTNQQRWTLNSVRLDTSGNMIDKSLQPDGPTGVNEELVRVVRRIIDGAWEAWGVPDALAETAQAYCKGVGIVVSGGFNREKIQHFEDNDVPVSAYGVGSSLLFNDKSTNTDFTMDLVRVRVDGRWVDIAKVGRQPCDNPVLRAIDLTEL